MTASEYNKAIQAKPSIGCVSWIFNGVWISKDILELENEFENEYFVRIRSHHGMPLVRITINENGCRVYFLTARSDRGDLDWPEFETAGMKCNFTIRNRTM